MLRVAIVGRPNVGKSTLFNRLCGARKAIVGDEPGITRDRIYGSTAWQNRRIEFLDTGGMIPNVQETIPSKILEQVGQAISEADLLLFVVDGRAGPTPLDEQLLPQFHKSGRPLWLAVNKIDAAHLEALTGSFYAFGAEQLFPISAEHGYGVADLLDALAERAPEAPEEAPPAEREGISVAVVGRPNVGKSSLVNRLLGYERAIVSEIPGTTRDALDTLIERDGVRFRLIDTAGIRRKGRTEERTEKVSVIMARKSLERAEVALLMLDAEEGVTKLDAAIGGYAAESGCSVIIVLNKWDKVVKDQETLLEHSDQVRRRMKYLAYAPIVSVSALTGQRVSKLFDLVRNAHEARTIRIPTGTLNNLFIPDLERRWKASNPLQKFDVRYVTQAGVNPPVFVVFTGGRKPLHFSTERFIINQLRTHFGFYATPIRIKTKASRNP
jgi:GTP-binding protein